MHDIPLAILTTAICSYWTGVGVMILRVRRKTHKAVGLVPEQRLERFMWLVWAPLVVAWIYVPWATLAGSGAVPSLPEFALREPWYAALRWIAAAIAVVALGATIKCWARMGNDWRMDVALDSKTDLITDGLYARIRHPIYAFSIVLLLCSAAIVPTLPMLAIVAIQATLWNIKARNEERHLLGVHGDAYARYLSRTGRFFPRWSAGEQ